MAIIRSERMTGLGWGVDFLSGNQSMTLYWPQQPSNADRDDRIRFYEQLWMDDIVASKALDIEEQDE